MPDYRVQLDAYAGPLDLLLYLVKRHEIDLHDIPIAALTDQYMAHLRLIQAIDVDTAGEFLVMAATLLEIKSQMLIPRSEDEAAPDAVDHDEPFDPRLELVQQLLAYKAYKDAANQLQAREQQWSRRFPAAAGKSAADDGDENAPRKDLDLEDVNVMDLCEAFARVLDSIGQRADHEITYDDTPISLHAEDIADRLKRDGAMTLQQIFIGRQSAGEMIGLFLATLELVRQKRVRVVQDRLLGEIRLESVDDDAQHAATEADDAPTDWRDPQTGEVQYDWPEGTSARKRRSAANPDPS